MYVYHIKQKQVISRNKVVMYHSFSAKQSSKSHIYKWERRQNLLGEKACSRVSLLQPRKNETQVYIWCKSQQKWLEWIWLSWDTIVMSQKWICEHLMLLVTQKWEKNVFDFFFLPTLQWYHTHIYIYISNISNKTKLECPKKWLHHFLFFFFPFFLYFFLFLI